MAIRAPDGANNNEGDCQKAESPDCSVTVIHSFISGRPAFLCIVNFLRHATVLCLLGFSSKTHEIKFGTEVSKWQKGQMMMNILKDQIRQIQSHQKAMYTNTMEVSGLKSMV